MMLMHRRRARSISAAIVHDQVRSLLSNTASRTPPKQHVHHYVLRQSLVPEDPPPPTGGRGIQMHATGNPHGLRLTRWVGMQLILIPCPVTAPGPPQQAINKTRDQTSRRNCVEALGERAGGGKRKEGTKGKASRAREHGREEPVRRESPQIKSRNHVVEMDPWDVRCVLERASESVVDYGCLRSSSNLLGAKPKGPARGQVPCSFMLCYYFLRFGGRCVEGYGWLNTPPSIEDHVRSRPF